MSEDFFMRRVRGYEFEDEVLWREVLGLDEDVNETDTNED